MVSKKKTDVIYEDNTKIIGRNPKPDTFNEIHNFSF